MQATTSVFGLLLSKQIRRVLPLYFVCVLLFLLFIKADHFERLRHNSGDVLKHALSYQSRPRSRESRIPKKIWQTWKVDPLEFEERDSTRARTWTQMNPSYRYEVLTDGNDLEYVETHFGPEGINRPDIVNTYRSLTAKIIKADLLRYLVMYIEGGYYADIDVSVLRHINSWIPPHFDERDVDLIIGVEIDEPDFANHTILGPKSKSFCQWTFACKPRVPVMMRLIDHVLHWLNEISQRQNVPISNISLNFNEVITGTGPSAFTGAILADMAAQTGRRLSWETFHALQDPILVGNTLVLTVEAFAAGQGHSNSGNHDSDKTLVKHHYHASLWPSRHPRYSHPAFGMVEECNWDPDCVEQWTKNTGAFDTLPEEHKAQLIAEKDAADKEKLEKEVAENEAAEKEEADRKLAELRSSCEAAFLPATELPSQTETLFVEAQPTEVPPTDASTTASTEPTEVPKEGKVAIEHPDMKRVEQS